MKKEIVLIGGGFAGVNFIRNLKNNEDYNITLVDKNNYNFFPPLLYQVATAFLEVSNISYPFRRLFRKNKNVNVRLATVTSIDRVNNKIILSNQIGQNGGCTSDSMTRKRIWQKALNTSFFS